MHAQLQPPNMKGRVHGDVVTTYFFAGQQLGAVASTSTWIGTRHNIGGVGAGVPVLHRRNESIATKALRPRWARIAGCVGRVEGEGGVSTDFTSLGGILDEA